MRVASNEAVESDRVASNEAVESDGVASDGVASNEAVESDGVASDGVASNEAVESDGVASDGVASNEAVECRSGCGACCIAPSISAPMPGFPAGKLAGVRCPHLTEDIRCALFGSPERPAVCRDLKPQPEMCGSSADEAMTTLARWEIETAPFASRSGG